MVALENKYQIERTEAMETAIQTCTLVQMCQRKRLRKEVWKGAEREEGKKGEN